MALTDEFKDTLGYIDNRDYVLGHLQKHRRTVMELFNAVITETPNTVAGKNQKFADGVLDALPVRFKEFFLNEFADWMKRYGPHILAPSKKDNAQEVSIVIEVYAVNGEAVVILTDYYTHYSHREVYRFEDLVQYLRAGLEWSFEARTFFIPRS